MAQTLDQGTCGIVMSRGREAELKHYEPTDRKLIRGRWNGLTPREGQNVADSTTRRWTEIGEETGQWRG